MVPVLLVLLAFGAFAQVQQPSSSGGAGAGGDGAVVDGVSSSIKATVKDYTNANPLTTIIVDTNGDPASLGGGSQYAEGATQATPTGTVALGKDSGNILRSILVDTNRNLLVGINLALPTGANTIGGVNLSQYTPVSGRLPVDGSGVTQPVSGTVTANLAAGTNNIGDVDVVTLPSVTVGTFPDNEPFNISQYNGATVGAGNPVHITCVSGCGGAAAFDDNSAFTAGTSDVTNIGAVYNDGLADVTSGNAAAPRITADRGLHVNLRNNTGGEIGTAGTPIRVDPTGTTTQPVSAASLPLPTGASTLAEQQTQTAALVILDNVVRSEDEASGDGHAGAVVLARRTATPANTSGADLDYEPIQVNGGRLWASAVLEAGTANIGDVDVLTFPDNEPFNMAQIAGTAASVNTGNADAGTQRNVIATNNPAIANWGHAAIAAAPPTGATYIAGVTSGATGGLLSGITVCDSFANIQQTANTQIITGVSGRRIYICSINLVTDTAQDVSVVAGTGSVCATTTVAVPGLSGGATAATGWNFSASSGIALGGGLGAIAKTTVNADNLCVFQSGSGQLSGGISYAIY